MRHQKKEGEVNLTASDRTGEISKAIDSALIRTCYACNAHAPADHDGRIGNAVGTDDLRAMLDIWWRFNLLTDEAKGESNAFSESSHFEIY